MAKAGVMPVCGNDPPESCMGLRYTNHKTSQAPAATPMEGNGNAG